MEPPGGSPRYKGTCPCQPQTRSHLEQLQHFCLIGSMFMSFLLHAPLPRVWEGRVSSFLAVGAARNGQQPLRAKRGLEALDSLDRGM